MRSAINRPGPAWARPGDLLMILASALLIGGAVGSGLDGFVAIGELEDSHMDLTLWVPALFVLGLVTMGTLFAFVVACEKV